VEGLGLEISSLKREREEIRKNLASLQSRVERSPRREQEMIAITRDYENLRTSYNDLLRKKIEAGISQDLEKVQKGEQFQVLDPANLPENPFKPNRKLIFAYSFIAACILGFGGAVGLEALDPTLRGRRDFKLFFDLNILACIPVLQDGKYARKRALRRAAILGGIVSFTVALTLFLVLYGERIRAIVRG
jgi:succinoglycan biosynthesis transport protein ExoP